MKNRIILGESKHGAINIDIEVLLKTRLLIQANSGGGKSYLLRRLAEQLFGKVPVIIIDPEGEFATLREKFGYVLVGKGGETPADCRSAGMVAHKLLELRASAVCDLYELKPQVRHQWVRLFLEALIDAPKELWRPTVIIVDEAHCYCLSDDTELLTVNGWKSWKEITPETVACTYDIKTESFSFEKVQRVIVKHHFGEMVRIKSDGIDCLVTPDHRVVMQRIQRAKGRYKIYRPTFCQAKGIPHHIYIPIAQAPIGTGMADLTPDMARLLGWVITDGCYVGGDRQKYISITQSDATKKSGVKMVDKMREVITKLGGLSEYRRNPRSHTSTSGREKHSASSSDFYLGANLSAKVLSWLNRDGIHRIPRSILENANQVQLEAILIGLLEGDGTCGNVNHGWCGWINFYPGNYEPLADDFQELCLRLGICTVKKWVESVEQWHVHISRKKRHYIRKSITEQYRGIVWDITVPSGAFVARRRGTVFITGNCPEGKAGESEASSGMVDLATRGRKRGYCAVFATQRLGKLRKDAAAELLNVLIGMTFIDIDRERAAESLGVSREEKHKFNDEIKLLTEGHFYGLGRAIAKERTLLKIGSVCTTHPEAGGGKFAAAPPPAPEAIRGMLPKLAELPKQAEEKAKTEADLRTEIRKLKAELSQKPAVAPPQKEVKHFPILTKANEAVLNRTSKAFENFRKLLDDKLIIFPKIADELAQLNKGLPRSHTEDAVNYARAINNARQSVPQRIKVAPARPPGPVIETNNGDWKPTGPEMKVLSVLAQYEDYGVEIGKLALLSCRQVNGTMRNVLASLRSHGCMDGENTAVMYITETGKAYGPFEALPVGDALADYWRSHKAFGGPERVIFECFLEHPNGLTIDDLAEKTNRQVNGTLRNNLAKLRTAGVLLGKNTETMRLTEDLINQ